MATLQDSFNTGEDGEGVVRPGNWRSQSFTTSVAYSITSVKILVYKQVFGGNGAVTVSIRATDGSHKPIEADLASGTFSRDDLTDNSAGEWKEITFGSAYSLSTATKYAIVVGPAVSTGDLYWLKVSTGDPYPTGKHSTSANAGSTWATASSVGDFMFETWGNSLLPTKATTPVPADADASVTLDQATIAWTDGGNSDTYNVYYGPTSGSLPLVSPAQAGTSFSLSGYLPYDYGVTRYWRIDSTNASGTTTGTEWSFTTIALAPPVDVATVRRLIAVANNKFWYESV